MIYASVCCMYVCVVDMHMCAGMHTCSMLGAEKYLRCPASGVLCLTLLRAKSFDCIGTARKPQ